MNSDEETSVRRRLAEIGEDRRLSPYTGWTREHLAALADELLLAVRPYASADRSQILLPSGDGREVRPIDGLEGFARTFMLAAFRLTGEKGQDPLGLADWYAEGLTAGVNPENPTRWPRPDERPQAKVEAAALALGLHLTREWIWERLGEDERRNVAEYLGSVVGTDGPNTNWVWFRLVVEQFLISVGGRHDLRDIEADLEAHESFVREGGWYADGVTRAFDYYNGWALQLYPFLWLEMAGGGEAREAAYRQRFDEFVTDAVALVGADGAPLAQGRSLIYRFAAAAPFWTAALIGSDAISLGQARRAAVGIVKHFVDRGVPDARGLLSLGWFHEWTSLAQDYSGTGSPYWAAKGLLGLALPADHAIWAATEEPLPSEHASFATLIPAPAWLVGSTADDGIVRVYNHGTDHALPGAEVSDIPLYARLAYSTATFPLLKLSAGRLPDSSVVVLDAEGRVSSRTGFERLTIGSASFCVFGFSRWRSRWMDITPGQLDYSNGFTGSSDYGPEITVGSVVREEWEVRLVRLSRSGYPASRPPRLALTGWPISGPELTSRAGAEVHSDVLRSALHPLEWNPRFHEQIDNDATPLSGLTGTPCLVDEEVVYGRWMIAAVELSGAEPRARPVVALGAGHAVITWWDGVRSDVPLPGYAPMGGR
ncbi:DUF2264 domain-containing protein [Microbacterium sp. DT81.1]|uniref:DUF2264 domain-containing protein n=1 Tax=Microbacterium sp. DT81.1 TaxID=3393413 RepID=UPI003CE80B99